MKLATIAAIAAICLATPAMAQEACPASHDDYRHPTPVWGGFGEIRLMPVQETKSK
jgi:hypothetical protein